MSLPWILISVLVIIILLAVVAVIVKRKKKTPPDYYTFFILGITWVPLGFALEYHGFTVMGLVFMTIGLLNKDKWKKNHRPWDKLSKEERKIKIFLIIALGVLVILGLAAFLLAYFGILPL